MSKNIKLELNILDRNLYSPIYRYKNKLYVYDINNSKVLELLKDDNYKDCIILNSFDMTFEDWQNKSKRNDIIDLYTKESAIDYNTDTDNKELNLNEKVEIKYILNPVLWDENKKLKPEIKDKIIEIVDEFKDSISDFINLKVLDINIVGSNASYNYTDKSDIDIHIITNFEDYGEPAELVQAAMNANKTNFNKSYDIAFKNFDVEVYVEDVKSSPMSNGIYSVFKDEWIKEPIKIDAPDVDLEPELSEYKEKIQSALDENSSKDINEIIDDLYVLRRESLVKDGEFGKGNLIFKEIRNLGLLDKLKDKKVEIRSNELSVESLNESEAPSDYEPHKKGKAYKVFKVKNGKLYPPMVANPGGTDTPIGKWLIADEGEFAGLSKTGRPQVKSTGSGTLSYRPGWHLGDIPRASQFDRTNKETGEKEFPKDFVWAECEYTMDIDYQPESDEQGYMRIGKDGKPYRSDKYQHSLAGLPKLPKDGYYKYRTNPRPDTVPWVITGAIKVNKLLSDDEVNNILKSKGIEPIHRQGGDKTLSELGLKESNNKYLDVYKLELDEDFNI